MNQLPHLSILHQLYLTEEQPFRKVHRMIDLFESIIKTHTVVILAGYVKHNKLSDKAKGLLSQGLRTPSLGTWQLFSRVLFEELSNDNNRWISNSFAKEFNTLEKALQSEKTNVIAFRNGYAHGATPTDAQCVTDIQKFDPFLKQLMQFEWLRESSLVAQEGKVWISTNQESLCLHPILLYRKEDSDASYAFFNDLKNDKIGLLNYTLSKHYKEKELFAEFHEHLPLHEWKKSGNNEFYQRIEELTETFKGRTLERDKILQFVLQKSKGYFSIQGNPGIGKSALIAQIIKDLRAHPELKNIKVIEYFIRRGIQQAQVEYLFNYLIRRTDEVFEDGRDIRAEGKMVFDLQNQLFSKWRLWGERNNGQQLLFLIDGLDEGVENNIVTYLPRENFENILFIYGSRPGGHKSIDDLWGQLPTLNHIKLELFGLGKEDIRALIYEVANKYELSRESAWIDAVQMRSQGNPLYLKLLCDAIENESISLNDINALPKQIDEYYKAILFRYAQDTIDGDALLTGLFTFAAAKDYLTFAHLGLINQLGQASIQRIGSALKEVLIENPLTEDVLDFQLFHESFREYLVRENQKQVSDAVGRIINFSINWKELSGSWEQRYALEHLATHLSESKKSHHHELLMELIYNQAYVTEQKKILKNFDSSTHLYQLGLLKASELDKFDYTLEAALCLVDLHYEEANDAPQIIEMVANGDIDLALKRIESFGGSDQEGMQRKFILYMLCLMELTLLGSKEKPFKKLGIQKLLSHLDDQIPMDKSLLDWYKFFPYHIVFSMTCEWIELDTDYQLIFDRTSCLDSEWITKKGPFSNFQIGILLKCANGISNEWSKSVNLKNISIALSKQGKYDEAIKCAQGISKLFQKVAALSNISTLLYSQNYLEEAKSLIKKSIEISDNIFDDFEKNLALSEIIFNLSKQGEFEKALEFANDIADVKQRSNSLKNISLCLANQGKIEKGLDLANLIEVDKYKLSALSNISSELFLHNNLEDADSLIKKMLELADSILKDGEKNLAIKDIAINLAKQNKIEKALVLVGGMLVGIYELKQKSGAYIDISNCLFEKKENEKALTIMLEAVKCAIKIEDYEEKNLTIRSICESLFMNDEIIESFNVLVKALESLSGNIGKNKKCNTLLNISIKLIKDEDINAAIECAKGIECEIDNCMAFINISNAFFSQGKIDDALFILENTLHLVNNIDDDDWAKGRCLNIISSSLAHQDKINEAIECSLEIIDVDNKITALLNISSSLYKRESLERSTIMLQNALECARNNENERNKVRNLTEIALEFFTQELHNEANLVMHEAIEVGNNFKNKNGAGGASLWNLSRNLAKQNMFKEALECANEIGNERQRCGALIDISTEFFNNGEKEKSEDILFETIQLANGIIEKEEKNRAQRLIAQRLAVQGKWHLAEGICFEIPNIGTRQECWREMAFVSKEKGDWHSSLQNVKELQSDEARLFYLKGWTEILSPNETDFNCFKQTVNFLAKDSSSLENLLNAYALNQLMFGRPTKDQVKRLNKTLNLQWAIDVADKFPKEIENGRFSHNLKNWIYEIVDEDERDQIELWARQVLKGKISEEEFKNNLKNI
jgi:tetratricopeptide (TPR) repeat protein